MNQNIFRNLFLLALALNLSSCLEPATGSGPAANSQPLAAIYGGQNVRNMDPSNVRLDISKQVVAVWVASYHGSSKINYEQATGVIVGADMILTAAHTFAGLRPGTYNDGAGEYPRKVLITFGLQPNPFNGNQRSSDYEEREASAEDFSNQDVFSNGYYGPDYVLIHLSQPIPQGYTWMYSTNKLDQIQPGSPVKIAGYGLSEYGNDFRLRVADFTVSALDFNQAKFDWSSVVGMPKPLPDWFRTFFLEINQNRGPNQAVDKDACHGDSGAPVYYTTMAYDGAEHLMLGGIHLKHPTENCSDYSYELRVDGFLDDITDFYHKYHP